MPFWLFSGPSKPYKLLFFSLTYSIFLKLTPSIGLTKLPIRWCHVKACDSSTVAGSNLKREALAIEE